MKVETTHVTPGKRKQHPLPRSRSSILAFKLREFLDTHRTENAPQIVRKPLGPVTQQLSQPPMPPAPPTETLPLQEPIVPPPPKEDMVWVDAFFYGFYMEKSKAAAFQASLKQQGAKAAVPPRR